MNLVWNFGFTILLIWIVVTAGILLKHLGAGSVPPRLEPLARRWTSGGGNPVWINVTLWLFFFGLAGALFAIIGFFLYEGAVGLGRPYK